MSEDANGEIQPQSEADIVNDVIASGTETAANEAVSRADIEGAPDVTISDEEKKDVISSLLEGIPGAEATQEQRDAVASVIVDLEERDTIEQVEADHFAQQLS